MKKNCLFLLGFSLAVFASGCAVTLPFHKSESTSVSSSEDLSTDDENNIESISNETQLPFDTPENISEDDSETQQSSISEENSLENASADGLVKYDSIYDIPFVSLDFTNNGNSLTRNGYPWVSAPGTQKFGNLCFSDGESGYTLYTDDGYEYTLAPCDEDCYLEFKEEKS